MKNEKRKRVIERLHDQLAERNGEFRTAGPFAVVWINTIELTEQLVDDEWVPVVENKKPVEKLLHFRRVNVPVGDSIMGLPVRAIPREWIEQEKAMLERWKDNQRTR